MTTADKNSVLRKEKVRADFKVKMPWACLDVSWPISLISSLNNPRNKDYWYTNFRQDWAEASSWSAMTSTVLRTQTSYARSLALSLVNTSKGVAGAGDVAQLINHLLSKDEDGRSNPSTHIKQDR